MTELEKIVEAKNKAFDAMIENASAENLAKYEALLKLERDLNAKAVQEGQKKADLDAVKENVKPEALSEAVKFAKGIREALAIGSTYTAVVPATIAAEIQKKKYEFSNFRRYCTAHPASGNYTIVVEGNGVTVNYVAEGGQINDSTPTAVPVTLGAYKLAALVKISKEMLEDSAVDFVNYVVNLMAKGFALKEDHEVLLGAGSTSNEMTGVVTAYGTGSNKVTTAATTGFTWAEFKTFLGKLKAYKPSAVCAMAQSTIDFIHEFKDGSNYIFPQNQELTEIQGVKIIASPDVDEIGTGKTVAVAGDFSFYHIADRQELTITTLNELFAQNDQVGIKAVQRIDGKPANAEAFAFLVIK